MFRIHNYLPLLLVYILPAICSAQNLIRVMDNPKDYVGSLVRCKWHIDSGRMKRVDLLSTDASLKLDGWLMRIHDGSKKYLFSQRWGDYSLRSKPSINIFINKKLGALVREQVAGTVTVWVAFRIREEEIIYNKKSTRYFIADVLEMKPAGLIRLFPD